MVLYYPTIATTSYFETIVFNRDEIAITSVSGNLVANLGFLMKYNT